MQLRKMSICFVPDKPKILIMSLINHRENKIIANCHENRVWVVGKTVRECEEERIWTVRPDCGKSCFEELTLTLSFMRSVAFESVVVCEVLSSSISEIQMLIILFLQFCTYFAYWHWNGLYGFDNMKLKLIRFKDFI